MDENDNVGEEGYNKDKDMKENKKTVEDTISRKLSAWLEDLRNSLIVRAKRKVVIKSKHPFSRYVFLGCNIADLDLFSINLCNYKSRLIHGFIMAGNRGIIAS